MPAQVSYIIYVWLYIFQLQSREQFNSPLIPFPTQVLWVMYMLQHNIYYFIILFNIYVTCTVLCLAFWQLKNKLRKLFHFKFTVPPLENFVMNRVLGDYFETLMYKIFVSIDEHTNIAEVSLRFLIDLFCEIEEHAWSNNIVIVFAFHQLVASWRPWPGIC